MSANDSEFTGNSATGTIADGGGIFNDDGGLLPGGMLLIGDDDVGVPSFQIPGGGCDDGGRVILTESTVEHHSAKGTTAAGGGIFANGATTLTKTQVSGNLPDNCSPPARVKDCGSN